MNEKTQEELVQELATRVACEFIEKFREQIKAIADITIALVESLAKVIRDSGLLEAEITTSRFNGHPKKPFIDRYHARGMRMKKA